MVRLQKFVAEAGVASRRAAEGLIAEGRIAVNGRTVTTPGTKVDPEHDEVTLDGDPVRARKRLYVALHKPPGYLCTRNDPEQRRVVAELIPREWSHLHSVGRLDRASEGLLLLTNDGEFTLKLSHPRYGVRKIYFVIVAGLVTGEAVGRMTRGVRDGADFLKAQRARIHSANNTRSTLEIELTEGKNREVRRLLAACGFDVERLIRTAIGPLKLGDLPSGKWRSLTDGEIKSLLPR